MLQAESLVLSLRDLFQAVFETKQKQRIEEQRTDVSRVVAEAGAQSEPDNKQVAFIVQMGDTIREIRHDTIRDATCAQKPT